MFSKVICHISKSHRSSNWSSLGWSQLSNPSDLPCCIKNILKHSQNKKSFYKDMLRFVCVWCMCSGEIVLYLSNTTQLFLSRKAKFPKWWWNCHGDWLYSRVFPVLSCPFVVWSQPVLDSAGWRVRHIDCWGNPDCIVQKPYPGALITRPTGVLPQDFVQSRSRGIRVYTFPIALQFDRHLGSSAADMPVNLRTIRSLYNQIYWLWDFTRFCGSMSFCLVNRCTPTKNKKTLSTFLGIWCEWE